MQVKVNSEVIFDECQDCGKELNEMEVEYCENKYSNTSNTHKSSGINSSNQQQYTKSLKTTYTKSNSTTIS